MDPVKQTFAELLAAASAAVAAIAATGAWITSMFTKGKMSEIHVLINSRLSELLDLTKKSSFAAGKKEEKDKQEQFDAGAKSETDRDKKP